MLPSAELYPIATFFDIHARLDLHTATEQVSNMIQFLLIDFPENVWLKSMVGMVHYHLRGKNDRDFFRSETRTDAFLSRF